MAKILWACWDGGGNLPPSLGIAKELSARGHVVSFVGRPEMVVRAEAAGVAASALAQAATDLPRYSFTPGATVHGYVSSPTVGAELVQMVDQQRPDVVVIDAMFGAALEVAPQFRAPTLVMLHTFLNHLIQEWRQALSMQGTIREQAGFDPLPDLDTLWGSRDLLHTNSLAALDGPPGTNWSNVRHGAPVLWAEPGPRTRRWTFRGTRATPPRSSCSASAR